MIDLNDLRIFEKVATLRGFSDAARALTLPKSSVSRSIARLEAALGARLLQRTTRDVVLTPVGEALRARCRKGLAELDEAIGFVSHLNDHPRGLLRISSGIGFGINVLAGLLPRFLVRYPDIRISLDLTGQVADLVAESIDVAIRLGPLPDSSLVAVHLGTMHRHLCAAPGYLARRGTPSTPGDVALHDTIEMPGPDGRQRTWVFTRGEETVRIELQPRVCVNEALTIQRMVVGGAGLGIVSGYLCAPDFASGRLVRLLPDWAVPPVEVNAVFPSRRLLAPPVRAFVDFVKDASGRDALWQGDPVARAVESEPAPG